MEHTDSLENNVHNSGFVSRIKKNENVDVTPTSFINQKKCPMHLKLLCSEARKLNSRNPINIEPNQTNDLRNGSEEVVLDRELQNITIDFKNIKLKIEGKVDADFSLTPEITIKYKTVIDRATDDTSSTTSPSSTSKLLIEVSQSNENVPRSQTNTQCQFSMDSLTANNNSKHVRETISKMSSVHEKDECEINSSKISAECYNLDEMRSREKGGNGKKFTSENCNGPTSAVPFGAIAAKESHQKNKKQHENPSGMKSQRERKSAYTRTPFPQFYESPYQTPDKASMRPCTILTKLANQNISSVQFNDARRDTGTRYDRSRTAQSDDPVDDDSLMGDKISDAPVTAPYNLKDLWTKSRTAAGRLHNKRPTDKTMFESLWGPLPWPRGCARQEEGEGERERDSDQERSYGSSRRGRGPMSDNDSAYTADERDRDMERLREKEVKRATRAFLQQRPRLNKVDSPGPSGVGRRVRAKSVKSKRRRDGRSASPATSMREHPFKITYQDCYIPRALDMRDHEEFYAKRKYTE